MDIYNFSKIMRYLIISFILASTICANGILRSDDGKIVDADGTEIIFRGIGLGGWLVPEGYMFNMSGFANSPTEIKNKIIELVGEANTEIIYQEYRDAFFTESDLDSLAKWGFNNIRLPMHYDLLTPRDQPYVYTESGFALIDTLVAWCKKRDIYLILDLHAAPGGQSAGPISDYDPNFPALWDSDLNKARTVDLWREIASRYANEEIIAGYEMLNEPAWGDLGYNNIDLRNLYINITNAIRTVDTNHIVFAEGNWYATDPTGLTPPWDDNMGYAFHKYWSEVNTGSIQNYLSIRAQNKVPIWMSESGENSNSWFTSFVKLLEDNKIGWTWWTLKKFESISPLSSVTVSPQFQVLMNYWDHGGSKPSVDYSMAALRLQIENFRINNCDTREDVLDALFRRPFNNDVYPFADNKIPGRLYGVNFDNGNQGTAYYDVDPDNNGSGSYNNGWTYRNEGVDIEASSDQVTNGYNIGWIESGEWLKFSVNVTQSGTYKIRLRIAAQESGGKIHLLVDGNQLTGLIDVPVTGGWQNWQTLQVDDVQLTAGNHELVIKFYFGGFNFNFMEYELTAVGVNEDNFQPLDYNMEQNYPNPFNPETTITFSLPEKANVKISVHNVLGEQVKVLENGVVNAGKYETKFDGQELSSGLYFIRLQANNYIKTIKATLIK